MSAKGKASVERLQAENAFLKRGGIAEEVGKTVRFLVGAAAACFVAYMFALCADSLAGKSTNANILVNLAGKFEASLLLSWGVGVGGVLYGRGQRKLRKSTTERLTQRIVELEQGIDPNRSSSKLTKTGDTNPEDR